MSDTLTSFDQVPFYDDEEAVPVTRITAGSVGQPGDRVFILQAHFGAEPVCWLIEKDQAVSLSRAIPALLNAIHGQFPELRDPLVAAEPDLDLYTPLVPEYRVGSLGLSYDRIHDLVVLSLVDISALRDETGDDTHEEEHVYTTRGQALLLSQQAERVVAAGRPYCPGCGEPIDDFGHFCPPPGARNRRSGGMLH